MLIGICGKSRNGKDTIADYLVSKYAFEKLILSEPLKEACKILFGFNDEQLYGNSKEIIDPNFGTSPRIILQYLGTDIFRKDINKIIPNINDNFWMNIVIKKYLEKCKENKNTKVVISDIRFKNEIDTFRKMNGILIKIIRPNVNTEDQHESEKNIPTLECDHDIINDGTIQDLYKKIDFLIQSLNLSKENCV